MNIIINRIYIILVSIMSYCISANGQSTLTFIDKETQKTIQGVSYQYGSNSGQSDKYGKIKIDYNDKDNLIITHISYELLNLNPSQVKQILNKGEIELQLADKTTLSPVSIYALKGKPLNEKVKLGNVEWIQHDAGQVLQQIPGFSAIRKSGDFSFDPTFRCCKLDEINIITDGCMSTLAACPSRMDPPTSQILISQIDQVEIMKGPHSFRYGPSFGAVINFKTNEPQFVEDPKVFGRINGGYETNGEIYRSEGMVGIRSKKMQIAAIGSYSKGHDYKDGNDSIIPARFSRGSIGLQTNFLVKQKNVLSFSATKSFARTVDFPTLMMDLLTDDAWMLQGHYKISGQGKWFSQWNTQLYASFVNHLMGNKYRPAAKSMDANTDAATKVLGGRTEWAVTSAKSELFFGLDAKHEAEDGNRTRKMLTGTMAGKTIIDTIWQDSRMTRGGTFADWHYQLQQYKLSVSGRVDVVYANANNPSSKFKAQYNDVSNTDVNPSLSIGISRQWDPYWFTGLWLGRGVRSAGIPERYMNSLQIGIDPYEMLGNPKLKAEANHQADLIIGFKYGGASLQLNAFASMVSNYISSVKTSIPPLFGAPGVRKYMNIDRALLTGFEFEWAQQYIPQLQHRLSVAYSYGKNDDTGKPLPQIAPLDLNYTLEGKLLQNKVMPYAQLRYVAKQDRVAEDYGEAKTPEFTTMNIGLRAEFVKNLQFSLAVNNIFDRAYREHLSRFITATKPLNSTGRSIVIMASYTF
jgi:iron complex outermembrane recepter protein